MRIVPRLESLRKKEHTATVEIIEGLLELKKSAEHLELGYASIWDFLIGRLHYSNAAASRRYKAMKCAEKFPQVLTMLREHRTNLTALAKAEATLARAADPEELLAEIDGQSSLAVERVVARHNPRPAPRERVRRRFVRPNESERSATNDSEDGLFAAANSAHETASSSTKPTLRPDAPVERVTLSLSLSPEDFADFERARALLSRKLPAGVSLEDALCELVAFYLKKKGPRPPRENSASGKSSREKRSTRTGGTKTENSRHVPRVLRDEVWRRDGGRCTYVGRDGRRCTRTHDLQLDHIEPFAVGGKTTAENLRLLCGPHNRHRTRGLVPQRKSVGGGSRVGESKPVYGRESRTRGECRPGGENRPVGQPRPDRKNRARPAVDQSRSRAPAKPAPTPRSPDPPPTAGDPTPPA